MHDVNLTCLDNTIFPSTDHQAVLPTIDRLAAELKALDHTHRTERFKQLPAELWVAVYAALPPAKQNRELAQCLAMLR